MRNEELSKIEPQNSSQGTLRCFAHPSIILGVIAGTATVLGSLIWLVQQILLSGNFLKMGILGAAGFGGILIGGVFALTTLEKIAIKLGSAPLCGFFYGLFYPFLQLASLAGVPGLQSAIFEGFGTIMRSCNRFIDASICYRKAANWAKPFSNERLSFERAYAESLFYAGEEEQATLLAEKTYKNWLEITKEIIREEAIERLGQSAYTAATIYNLTGRKYKASHIQKEFYERAKKCKTSGKAHLFALLCEGERLTREQQFTEAIVPLTEFCETASSKWTFPSSLLASGYSNLAICQAHLGKKELALKQQELAIKKLRDDLGKDSRLAELLLEADILIALEETSKAEEILAKAAAKMKPSPNSVICGAIEKKRKESMAPLSISEASPTEKSEIAQTIVPDKSDTQFPPLNFRTRYGTLLTMNTLTINSLFSGIVAALFFHSSTFAIKLAILVLVFVAANVVLSIISNQKGNKAKIALTNATKRDVMVQLKGTTIELREPEKLKPIGQYYINWSLQEETQEIVGNSKFRTTAFEHEGSFIAIEIFGQYANLTKSGFFP
ncbi:MAG: hypothetical protein QG574_1807 [Cyanobacteriota bacterium erpe_2018_sw_21hr_WHONDRS-SW48-000092_B_bin.40]|jgi:tetratricopeptide (TPR) repeat protein|nr:hypothetical protein [Cyanobacteriota bacterium erpe_2018_sw_21hr_WHONDRS-SW48-000092_B_bin.40]